MLETLGSAPNKIRFFPPSGLRARAAARAARANCISWGLRRLCVLRVLNFERGGQFLHMAHVRATPRSNARARPHDPHPAAGIAARPRSRHGAERDRAPTRYTEQGRSRISRRGAGATLERRPRLPRRRRQARRAWEGAAAPPAGRGRRGRRRGRSTARGAGSPPPATGPRCA